MRPPAALGGLIEIVLGVLGRQQFVGSIPIKAFENPFPAELPAETLSSSRAFARSRSLKWSSSNIVVLIKHTAIPVS